MAEPDKPLRSSKLWIPAVLDLLGPTTATALYEAQLEDDGATISLTAIRGRMSLLQRAGVIEPDSKAPNGETVWRLVRRDAP